MGWVSPDQVGITATGLPDLIQAAKIRETRQPDFLLMLSIRSHAHRRQAVIKAVKGNQRADVWWI